MEELNNLIKVWKESLEAKGYPNIEESVNILKEIYIEYITSNQCDKKFVSQICKGTGNQYEQALAEMLFYDVLKKDGFKFLEHKDYGPDFYVKKNGLKIWFELVTPQLDQKGVIKELHTNFEPLNPNEENAMKEKNEKLLRITSAIKTKYDKYKEYIKSGRVKIEDCYVIVVNDALLCHDLVQNIRYAHYGVSLDSTGTLHPLIVDALLLRKTIKKGNDEIHIVNFLEDTFSDLSAVVQVTLRDDYGFKETLLNTRSKNLLRVQGLYKIPDIVINTFSKNNLPDELCDMNIYSKSFNELKKIRGIQLTKEELMDF